MTDKSKQPLFSGFHPYPQEWMDKITADLKGLILKSSSGKPVSFSVRPFTVEDLGALKHLNSLRRIPVYRGNSTDNNWLVR